MARREKKRLRYGFDEKFNYQFCKNQKESGKKFFFLIF